MKIGIDAKWFFNGPPSGRVVVRNHVRHLVDISDNDELYIFLDKRDLHKQFPYERSNVHKVYVWADNNLLSNVFILPHHGRKLNLDVILFHNFPGNSRYYASISFIHDSLFLSHPQFYTLRERLYFSPLQRLARRASLVCTVSHEEKLRLIQYNYKDNETSIEVVYHGVGSEFRPLSEHPKEAISKVVNKYSLPAEFLLYVGRLNERKNIYNLVKALPYLGRKIPLVIVGGKDWKMFDLNRLVNEVGVSDRVIFTGPVYGKDLPCIYALAAVFCFPSHAESFGLPPLEAMASGVPVVVSNTTSIPEICGAAGVYVEPDSPEGIANAIETLLGDKEFYKAKVASGLSRSKDFTWANSARTLQQSFHSLEHKRNKSKDDI